MEEIVFESAGLCSLLPDYSRMKRVRWVCGWVTYNPDGFAGESGVVDVQSALLGFTAEVAQAP